MQNGGRGKKHCGSVLGRHLLGVAVVRMPVAGSQLENIAVNLRVARLVELRHRVLHPAAPLALPGAHRELARGLGAGRLPLLLRADRTLPVRRGRSADPAGVLGGAVRRAGHRGEHRDGGDQRR